VSLRIKELENKKPSNFMLHTFDGTEVDYLDPKNHIEE
jgi:hypothetical protein